MNPILGLELVLSLFGGIGAGIVFLIATFHRPPAAIWEVQRVRRPRIGMVGAAVFTILVGDLSVQIGRKTKALPRTDGAVVMGGVVGYRDGSTRSLSEWMGGSRETDPLRAFVYRQNVKPLILARWAALFGAITGLTLALIWLPKGPLPASHADSSAAVASGAVLEMLDGPLAGSLLTLPPGRTTLGRDGSNRVVLLDASASSRHAAIVFESGQCRLEDLGSSNGTFVDERRVTAPRALGGGERIRMGGTSFLFRRESLRT